MVRIAGRMGLGIAMLVSLIGPAGCQNSVGGKAPAKKVVLWNGENFNGWVRIVADPNAEVNDVWQARDGVLFCAGKPNGYIRTEDGYQNYHLHVEWRWPQDPANSGVLLHAQGPGKVWPPCIECQLKAGSAGDLVLMNGTGLTVDGVHHQNPARQFVVIGKRGIGSENPAGQWNSYDIFCRGDSIRCLVNNVPQNEGTKASVSSGWIALQSEGGPIEFRNIYLEPLGQ